MTIFGQGVSLEASQSGIYMQMDVDTSYFTLIGRKMFNELGAIVSTLHLKIKFLILTGEIMTVKAD